MPFILIKNNLKLMLRNKWILFIMVILPVITIALLSNAFQKMMDTVNKIEDFKVGYRIAGENVYEDALSILKTECSKNGIILEEYPEGSIEELLQNKTVASFIEVKDEDSYVVYKSNDKKTEAAITESIFSTFFYQMNENQILSSALLKQSKLLIYNPDIAKIKNEKLETEPVPSSVDYYGIIYIVYFAWAGMISLVAVITSERKSAIPKRMLVSHMPRLHYFMGKFIPCTLAIYVEISAAWLISVLLLDIHWGNIGMSAFIVLLVSMGASALGIFLFQLFNNVALSIVAAYLITWVAGFFGGSFQPYIYSGLPENLIKLSPIYYINRTLVEFSTKGFSEYTGRCLGNLAGIIVIFGLLGILLMNRKMEEN